MACIYRCIKKNSAWNILTLLKLQTIDHKGDASWKCKVFGEMFNLTNLSHLANFQVHVGNLVEENNTSLFLHPSSKRSSTQEKYYPVSWCLEYDDCILCGKVRLPSKKQGCSEYATKLYLMVRLQFWRSGEYGVPFITLDPHFDLEW